MRPVDNRSLLTSSMTTILTAREHWVQHSVRTIIALLALVVSTMLLFLILIRTFAGFRRLVAGAVPRRPLSCFYRIIYQIPDQAQRTR